MEVCPTSKTLKTNQSKTLWLVALFLGLILGLVGLFFFAFQQEQQAIQSQEDPGFVHAWIEGVRYGPNLTLSTGDPLTKWLARYHLPWFQKPHLFVSRYQANPGSLELWLGYQSELPNHPDLVCHRVGRTAFIDNFGQAYHGFLDVLPHAIGIYLPGYDHSASELICTLHWMPSPPDPPFPVSEPMRFFISLPHYARKLPPAKEIPNGPVVQTRRGVTVTLSHVYLSDPQFSDPDTARNEITFHLKIEGGTLAASNVLTTAIADPFSLHRSPSAWPPARQPLSISDPYGFPLISPDRSITPMYSLGSFGGPLQEPDGAVWVAPVDGAGRSTDVVRFRFDVRPRGGGALIPFDMVVRVHHDASV
ncbi:hypothetical protein CWRG_01484 [Chthonomonas calidirosea]|uniref:hypothetical protein n=1 Tax=Chthonomonas calidirosea TaxID=454171 RepID=UPI0006DD4C5F|nr:hypothetical protein [Chthonomonas calidirosea]CEK16422.1 hypothetical protein CWRG_01484 [Chthonomonas calidirosea]